MNVLCFYFNVLRYLNVLVSSCVLSVCVSTSDVWNKIVSLPPLTRRCHVLLLINHLLRLHYSLLLSAHLPLIHLLLLLHRSPPAAQHKHSSALPPAVCLVLLEACFSSLPPHPLVHPSEFYVGCITFRSFILNLLLLVFSDKTGDGRKIMGAPLLPWFCVHPVFPLVPISPLCSLNLGQKHGFFTFRTAVFFIIPTEHHPRLSEQPVSCELICSYSSRSSSRQFMNHRLLCGNSVMPRKQHRTGEIVSEWCKSLWFLSFIRSGLWT